MHCPRCARRPAWVCAARSDLPGNSSLLLFLRFPLPRSLFATRIAQQTFPISQIAVLLHCVQRVVGRIQELFDRQAVTRVNSDTRADGNSRLVPVLAQTLPNA